MYRKRKHNSGDHSLYIASPFGSRQLTPPPSFMGVLSYDESDP